MGITEGHTGTSKTQGHKGTQGDTGGHKGTQETPEAPELIASQRNGRKVLLRSFHLNGHTIGFYPQTQKLKPPCTA